MQDRVANTLIIGGALTTALGVAMIYVPAGMIVMGVMLVYGGIRLAVTGNPK